MILCPERRKVISKLPKVFGKDDYTKCKTECVKNYLLGEDMTHYAYMLLNGDSPIPRVAQIRKTEVQVKDR